MENKSKFLLRVYFISTILLVFGIGIGYKLFYLQFVEGDKYRKIAEDKTLKNFVVNSVRGNIFSDDGSLLATSTTKYDIFFDSKTVANNVFESELMELSEQLSKYSDKDNQYWYEYLNNGQRENKRYLPFVFSLSII